MNAKHTPGPWCTMYDGTVIRGFDGTDVARDVKSRDDARRIVQCVNAHDALAEAAGILQCLVDSPRFAGMTVAAAIAELEYNGISARAALAKTGGDHV
jgi:hypothetical protein